MKNEPGKLPKTALRYEAEAKLSARRKKTAPLPAMDADIQQLVHELEVHQIELEMQNEELMQVRAELEAALRQYTDLYDLAPVGYLTLSCDGTILQVNLKGAELLGLERGKVIKRRFGGFVSDQFLPAFNTFLEMVFASQENKKCEVALLKKEGDPIWVNIEAIFEQAHGQDDICHAVVRDVTVRKQAEEKLTYLSNHDVLTGLYNRNFFIEEMARFERGRRFPISIVMADVDQLKEANDQQGHAAGDDLLKRTAQALTAAFRAEDVIARIGGDEFAALLPGIGEIEGHAALERVRKAIREDNAVQTGALLYLSLGVSTANDPTRLSVTLQEADANMYREKRERNAS